MDVKETFAKLVAAHFIERCPAPEPSLQSKDPLEPPKKVPRGAAVSSYSFDMYDTTSRSFPTIYYHAPVGFVNILE